MTEPHPTIRPQPGILDIALYQGGEAKLAGHARVLKLSSNENPFGPSPKALAAALDRAGVPSDPSEANFILARFRDEAEAQTCDRALRERGIIVRRTASFKLPECLRITVGDAEACARVAEAVADFVRVRA